MGGCLPWRYSTAKIPWPIKSKFIGSLLCSLLTIDSPPALLSPRPASLCPIFSSYLVFHLFPFVSGETRKGALWMAGGRHENPSRNNPTRGAFWSPRSTTGQQPLEWKAHQGQNCFRSLGTFSKCSCCPSCLTIGQGKIIPCTSLACINWMLCSRYFRGLLVFEGTYEYVFCVGGPFFFCNPFDFG